MRDVTNRILGVACVVSGLAGSATAQITPFFSRTLGQPITGPEGTASGTLRISLDGFNTFSQLSTQDFATPGFDVVQDLRLTFTVDDPGFDVWEQQLAAPGGSL
ncbi:MAG: hypothetical protein AAF235_10580 [Planctomycetota bacterium]